MVEKFWKLLAKSGSDFTNTFRILSDLSESNLDQISEQIANNFAPKEFLIKTKRTRYGDNPKIMHVL